MQRPIHLPQLPPLPRAEIPPWEDVCNELRLQLPAELASIEGNRVRIDSVIAPLDEGDVVRDLSVTALTPAGNVIVRYHLVPAPSETLASKLAALISTAKLRETPAEKLLPIINACVEDSGVHYFEQIKPETSPLVQSLMDRVVPPFSTYTKNPQSIDTHFRSQTLTNGTLVRAVAAINLEQRVVGIEAHTYHENSSSITPGLHFKARCHDDFWATPRTPEESLAALLRVTWQAMETLSSEGPARAKALFSNPDTDNRLRDGHPRALLSERVEVLPSGARIMLEVGDSVACVTTEAQSTDGSTAFCWVISATRGLLTSDDPKLITTRAAIENLAFGDTPQRLRAIKTLDRLGDKSFRTPSLEDLVGYHLAESLTYVNNTLVRVAHPRSELQVLDILDGIQQIELTYRDPDFNRRNPQAPHFMRLGLLPDGGLKIEIVTPLGNHYETTVRGKHFKDKGGHEETIQTLVALFDKQNLQGLLELRHYIERLESLTSTDASDNDRLRPVITRLPSATNPELNRALNTAAEVVKLFEVVTRASISEVQVLFCAQEYCELVISNATLLSPIHLHLKVSQSGIHEIELFSQGASAEQMHPFLFKAPLSPVSSLREIAEIFKLLHQLSEDEEQVGPLAVLSTPLYKYLKQVEARAK